MYAWAEPGGLPVLKMAHFAVSRFGVNMRSVFNTAEKPLVRLGARVIRLRRAMLQGLLAGGCLGLPCAAGADGFQSWEIAGRVR